MLAGEKCKYEVQKVDTEQRTLDGPNVSLPRDVAEKKRKRVSQLAGSLSSISSSWWNMVVVWDWNKVGEKLIEKILIKTAECISTFCHNKKWNIIFLK